MSSMTLVVGTRTSTFEHGGGDGGPTSTGEGRGVHVYRLTLDDHDEPTHVQAEMVA